MRGPRYAAKADTTQPAIVQALRAIGAEVIIIGDPCDLLVGFRGRLFAIEVKSSEAKARSDAKGMGATQRKQRAFREHMAAVGVTVPVVWTEEMAIEVVSK